MVSLETGQREIISNCPPSLDLDHDQAKNNLEWEVIMDRKRKWLNQPEYEERTWATDRFNDQWLTTMNTYQPKLLPIDEIKKARSWFEYLPATPLYESKYRCWICQKYSDYFGVRKQNKPDLAADEGILRAKMQQNRDVIRGHGESTVHQEILSRLKVINDHSSIYKDIKWEEKEQVKVTARVMRSVYTAIKHMGASFNSMRYLISLQEKHGVDMGTQCKSRYTHTKMTESIGESMHQRLITGLKANPNPLSIIVDTSTDFAKVHELAVLFHTLENNAPVTYLYGLLKMGADETAEAQVDLLVKHLDKDGLYDHVKNHIASFMSDGASVMTGRKKGMGARLKKLFGPKLISHHCQNHRIELVFGHAMDAFNSFNVIESNVNDLYKFYKKSGKTFGSLRDFLDEGALKHFSLNYIFKIRWVASHYRAVKKVFDNHKEIVNHLRTIEHKTDHVDHNSGVIKAAKRHLRFLTDKRAMLLMVYNLDAQNAFKIQSKAFEGTDASIIGMNRGKQQLERDMLNVAFFENNPDSETQKFLSNVICGDMQTNTKCKTLENYEQAEYVIWKGIKLESYPIRPPLLRTEFEDLSEVKEPYVNLILDLMKDYFPDIRINDFDLLDQRLWNNGVTLDETTVNEKMTSLINEMKIVRPPRMGPKTIGKEFLRLALKIRGSPEWCQINKSKPSLFWSNIFKNAEMQMTGVLEKIIKSAIAIPAGSAAAERIFGKMNYIKDAHRATLSPDHLEHIIRIRHNGPEVGGIRLEPYTDKYLDAGNERCDPLHKTGKRIKIETEVDYEDENDEIFSTIFS